MQKDRVDSESLSWRNLRSKWDELIFLKTTFSEMAILPEDHENSKNPRSRKFWKSLKKLFFRLCPEFILICSYDVCALYSELERSRNISRSSLNNLKTVHSCAQVNGASDWLKILRSWKFEKSRNLIFQLCPIIIFICSYDIRMFF